MNDQSSERLLVELAEWKRSRCFGKYRGLVKDVNDPENMGRILTQVPEVYGEEDAPWALPAVPFAGQDHGWITLPEVGDGVWIEFEAGDISRPIWTGFWWGSGEMPGSSSPKNRTLVTSAGHEFALDDDKGEIRLLHSGGAEIKLTGSEISIKIGGTKIVLSASGISMNNGAFEVK